MALLVITIFVALTIRKYKAALFILITFVIFYGAWALFCKNQFGSFYPHTILVKTSLSKNIGIADSIKQMIKWALPRYFLIIILPVIPLITISFIMVVPKKNLLRTIKAPITILIMILWVVCVTLAYFLSGTYMASMYTLIFSPFIPIFCIAILYKTKESISEKRMSNYVFATLLFALIIGFGVISLRLGSYSWLVSDRYNRGDDSRYIEYAEWINKNLPDSARIATEELGIVGWFGQRYMIDLAGIATPSLLKPGADDTLVALKPTHFTFYGKPIDKYKNFELKPIKSVQFRRIGGRYSLDYLDTCTLYEVVAILGR